MHSLLLSLVALGDGPLREARLDLVVLLDQSTAEAPVTDAAIVHATAFDAESLTDLTTLHHGVNPATASHTVDRAEYKSIAVAGIGSLHSRVSHTIGGFTQEDTGTESAEQARVAGRAIAEVVLPFLILDIRSLRVLLSHCE